MNDSILKNAEKAFVWAKKPFANSPFPINNYRMLYIHIQEALEKGIAAEDLQRHSKQYWPCLSRLLILDDPTLVGYLKPHYLESLDCQAGTTLLCFRFKDITGRAPKVRSWRYARQEVENRNA